MGKTNLLIIISVFFLASCSVHMNDKELESTKFINELAQSKFVQLEQNFEYNLLKKFSEKYRPIPQFKIITDSVLNYSLTSQDVNQEGVELCETWFLKCWNNLYKEVSFDEPKKLDGQNFNEFSNSIKLYQFLIADKALEGCKKQQFYFDENEVLVVPSKEKLKLNETFSAKIYLTGRNTLCNPEILIEEKDKNGKLNSVKIPITEGVGDFYIETLVKGDCQWNGTYIFNDNESSRKIEIPFKIKYTVE